MALAFSFEIITMWPVQRKSEYGRKAKDNQLAAKACS